MKPAKGAFRDFILDLPYDMPVPEVVARGKKAGLKFSPVTVRTARIRAGIRLRPKRAPTTVPKDLKTRLRAGEELDAAVDEALAREPMLDVAPEPEPAPMTGAAFVRSQPPDMPSAEVIAKGAAEGLSVSLATVYNTRSLERRGLAPGGGRKPGQRGDQSGPTAASFIRTCPMAMPTEEVVAAAADEGLTITKQAVYAARNAMRKKGLRGPQQAPGAQRSAARVSRAPTKSVPTGDASREAKRQQFKALILELGMDDAESIWADFASIRSGIRR